MKKLILMSALTALMFGCQKDDEINKKPVAGFEVSNVIVEAEQIVTFTNASFDEDGEVVKWSWDFGNGETSDLESPEPISYNEAGNYTIALKVWDNSGAESYAPFTKEIRVNEKAVSQLEFLIAWEYDTQVGFQTVAPAIAPNGDIVVGADANSGRGDANVYVISNSGETVLKYKTGNVVRCSPAIANDGTFYIGSYDRSLYGFKAPESTPLYQLDIDFQNKFASFGVDTDGTVYSAGSNTLLSFSSDLSVKNWEANTTNWIKSAPIITNNVVYVANDKGVMFAFNKTDGSKIWELKFADECESTPALGADGTIYACGKLGDGGVVIAINSDGTKKWEIANSESQKSSGISLGLNETLFVGDDGGNMNCLSQNDGSTLWSYKVAAKILSVPAVDNNGNIYFGDYAGNFYSLNKEGKEHVKTIKLGSQIWSSPAIGSDGTIYICVNVAESKPNENPSKVIALKSDATGIANSTWPMRSGNALRNGRANIVE